MAITGFICHDDYMTKLSKLTDEEVGRLFRALMQYHITGEAEVNGRESIAFDFIREDIDRAERAYKEKCETNRRNRLSAIDNARQRSSTVDNERHISSTNVANSNNNIIEENKIIKSIPFIDDDSANAITTEQNRVLDAAEDAGFPKTNSVRAKIINLYAEYGLQKMLDAIEACVNYGAVTIAYLTAVLKGEPKKQKEQPKNTAHDYTQRDYSNSSKEATKRMMIDLFGEDAI